jgi:fumarate reductase flavoprotein subunit
MARRAVAARPRWLRWASGGDPSRAMLRGAHGGTSRPRAPAGRADVGQRVRRRSRRKGRTLTPQRLDTDLLILGAGGAGLFAALHAHRADPTLDITIVVKGLLGKCGCTRMVQGGYNVALAPGDSVERHFMDTIEGGKWLPDQDLAWTLVSGAVQRIHELENELGCFFDRNPDGTVHQKAFAGQTFDRTVHKGDLTGIEIMNRLAEQVWGRGIRRLEEHRALDFVTARDGALAGVLLLDVRTGDYRLVRAKAVLLATGGGPTMYRFHTPSGDKSCDGLAMAVRLGLPMRDMEMVQFHPTGLLAGAHTRMTGTVLEEGLRGAGGYLLDGGGQRFMARYDARGERATRDIVSRAIDAEMRAGRTSPNGGVYLSMGHLGADAVRRQFKGMVERCADCGFDLAGARVEVVPTAHYMMGGVEFAPDCTTERAGLFVAGEDSGGVHGANRLGGNGVANSTVFGGIAGDAMAAWVRREGEFREADPEALAAAVARAEAPLDGTGLPGEGTLEAIREALFTAMWDDAGIVRDQAGLGRAAAELERLSGRLARFRLPAGARERAFNLAWHDALNLANLVAVSKVIVRAAQLRENSRGAHYRADFPAPGDLPGSTFTRVRAADGGFRTAQVPVAFTRVQPGNSLVAEPLSH